MKSAMKGRFEKKFDKNVPAEATQSRQIFPVQKEASNPMLFKARFFTVSKDPWPWNHIKIYLFHNFCCWLTTFTYFACHIFVGANILDKLKKCFVENVFQWIGLHASLDANGDSRKIDVFNG